MDRGGTVLKRTAIVLTAPGLLDLATWVGLNNFWPDYPDDDWFGIAHGMLTTAAGWATVICLGFGLAAWTFFGLGKIYRPHFPEARTASSGR